MAPQKPSLFAKEQSSLLNQSIFEHGLCVRTVLSLRKRAANKRDRNSYTLMELYGTDRRSHLSSLVCRDHSLLIILHGLW